MNLGEYQSQANTTDQRPLQVDLEDRSEDAIVIPLLGIGGELGTLQAQYKKYLRDGESHRLFQQHMKEELGDILWYVANLATKFGLELDDIAQTNLEKVQARWLPPAGEAEDENLFDSAFDQSEQLPRQFEVEFRPASDPNRPEPLVQLVWRDRQWGDPLGDNAYQADGYRFHDAFHLAHAAVLGWSPVSRRRKHFNCKRKSDPLVDAVEDGGRATAIEEGIVAYVYGHARAHGWFENIDRIDHTILNTISGFVQDLEVRVRSPQEWERAILSGYGVWRSLREHDGGIVVGDLLGRTIEYRPLDNGGSSTP